MAPLSSSSGHAGCEADGFLSDRAIRPEGEGPALRRPGALLCPRRPAFLAPLLHGTAEESWHSGSLFSPCSCISNVLDVLKLGHNTNRTMTLGRICPGPGSDMDQSQKCRQRPLAPTALRAGPSSSEAPLQQGGEDKETFPHSAVLSPS